MSRSVANRRQERERLIRLVEQGPWYERAWLPLLRLTHRLARKSDERLAPPKPLVGADGEHTPRGRA